MACRHCPHQPGAERPFVIVFVDEVAFLTAYQPDRKLREGALAVRPAGPQSLPPASMTIQRKVSSRSGIQVAR
jgi:hypothetical protein